MIELQCEIAGCPKNLEEFLTQVAACCMRLEGVSNASFTVRIVDDDAIRELNRDMRGIDRVTDVLSFPSVRYPKGTTAKDNLKRLKREYDPTIGAINLGDCAISLTQASRQADEYGHTLMRELGYLTAHSAFHLMGYDHMNDEDKRVMREKEEVVMRQMNLRQYRTNEVVF